MNPFSTRFTRPGALPYRFHATDPEDADSRHGWFRSFMTKFCPGQSLLIVGPHGSGKTTLLHDIISQCGLDEVCTVESQSRFITYRLHRTERSVRSFRSGIDQRKALIQMLFDTCREDSNTIVIDGLELVPAPIRGLIVWLVRWRRHRLLATSHQHHYGFLTVKTTDYCDDITTKLIHRLCQKAASPQKFAAESLVNQRRRQQGTLGNVRDLFFDLYDTCADHGPVKVPADVCSPLMTDSPVKLPHAAAHHS